MLQVIIKLLDWYHFVSCPSSNGKELDQKPIKLSYISEYWTPHQESARIRKKSIIVWVITRYTDQKKKRHSHKYQLQKIILLVHKANF